MRQIFAGKPTATRSTAWRPALLVLLAYTIITIALFWPVVQGLATTFPVDVGDPPNEAWIVAWSVHALTTMPSHILGGNIYYPHANALVYNDNLLGLLPLATPVYLLSGSNTALTYNVLFLLSFVLCGLGTFLLARRLTGSIAGAFLAGLIVAFSPYRMVHLSHLNQLSGQWLPLALLFWERARSIANQERCGRLWLELAGFGIFFILQALCSIYYAVFLATCLAIYLIVYTWSVGLARAWRFVAATGTAAIGVAIVLLPVMLPYLRLQQRVGVVRGPDQVLYLAADLRDFVHMPPFSALYGWTEAFLGVRAGDAHQYLFPGLVALVLMFMGIRCGKDRLTVRIYSIILAVTFIFALGRQLKVFDRVYQLPLPYILLYDHVPGYHSFRDPARFWFIGSVCLALLAAWGLRMLLESLRGWRPARYWLLATVICLATLAEYWISPVATPRVAAGAAIPPVYRWLKAQPVPTSVLELPIGQQNVSIWSQQAMMTYYATYHWQPIVNGVGGYTPAGYEEDAAVLGNWPSAAARRLLTQWHVRYVIWHPDWMGRPGPANSPRAPLVLRLGDGTSVYAVK